MRSNACQKMTALTLRGISGQHLYTRGHSFAHLATAVVLALLLRGSAGDTSISLAKVTITSSPVVYGCGFYTMSYRFWCDPTAVTGYLALFNTCNMSDASAAQSGGSSALRNSTITISSTGQVTATGCPPAPEYVESMFCSTRTTCRADWPGGDNSNMLCLMLVAGAPGFNVRSTCDLTMSGATSLSVAATAPASGTVESMTWWQILLIVVAGLVTLLLGVALLMCMWHRCCRTRVGAEASGVEAGTFLSSHTPDKPYFGGPTTPIATGVGTAATATGVVTGMASAGMASAAGVSLNKSLPPDVTSMPPAAVQRLRDTTLDDPNLYVPDDNKKAMDLSKTSTLLPGAVPKDPVEAGVRPEVEAKSAAGTAAAAGAATATAAASPPKRPSAEDLISEGASRSTAPTQQQSAPVAQPPSAAEPPPPPPTAVPGAAPLMAPQPQGFAPRVSPPGATAAGAAAGQAAAAAAATNPPGARSKSMFSRFFGKKQKDEGAGAGAAAAAAATATVASAEGLGPAPQMLLPEGRSSSAVPPPQQQPYMSPNQPQMQPMQGPGGAYPWQGPGHPGGAVQPPPPTFAPHSGPYSPSSPGAPTPIPSSPSMHAAMIQQQLPYQPPYLQGSLQPQSSFGAMGPMMDDPYGNASGHLPGPQEQLQRGFSMTHGSQLSSSLPPPLQSSVSGLGGEDALRRGGDLSRQQSFMQAPQEGSGMGGAGAAPPLLAPLRGPLQPLQPLQSLPPPRAGSFAHTPLDPPLPEPPAQGPLYGDGPLDPDYDVPRVASLDAPAPSFRSPGGSAGTRPWPPEMQDGAPSPREPLLQPLQPLKLPARGLQPLQPLQPSLRETPSWPPAPAGSISGGPADPADDDFRATAAAPPPQPDASPLAGTSGADEAEDPLEASLTPPQPRGLPPPLPPLGRGGLKPLGVPPLGGGGGGGGGGLPPPRPPAGGLAPLAPLPGPRKLTPLGRKTDDEDDEDVLGAGAGGGTSLRGEPSFGDERRDGKKAAAGSAGGRGGEVEDLDAEDLGEDRPAPVRRGGFM